MHFNRGHFVSTFKLTRDTTGTEYTGLEVLNSYEPAPASTLRSSVWYATSRRGHKYATV